jgi:NAD+ diphosphatase
MVGQPRSSGSTPFEQMNQVIIAYHVPASGTIALNEELDDFRHVPLADCKAWSGGTGSALRDWLRSKGFEPSMLELRTRTLMPTILTSASQIE